MLCDDKSVIVLVSVTLMVPEWYFSPDPKLSTSTTDAGFWTNVVASDG